MRGEPEMDASFRWGDGKGEACGKPLDPGAKMRCGVCGV